MLSFPALAPSCVGRGCLSFLTLLVLAPQEVVRDPAYRSRHAAYRIRDPAYRSRRGYFEDGDLVALHARYRGAEAVNAVVAAALGTAVPLFVYSLPGIGQLQDIVYPLVASNRRRLPGDHPYCAQHPAECR